MFVDELLGQQMTVKTDGTVSVREMAEAGAHFPIVYEEPRPAEIKCSDAYLADGGPIPGAYAVKLRYEDRSRVTVFGLPPKA